MGLPIRLPIGTFGQHHGEDSDDATHRESDAATARPRHKRREIGQLLYLLLQPKSR